MLQKKYIIRIILLFNIIILLSISNEKTIVSKQIMKNYYKTNNEIINILNYYNKIDYSNPGKPDYTKAIQAALDYAKNNANDNSEITIYIPSGTYYITSPLYIYSNTILELNTNATIINIGDKNTMLISGSKYNNCNYGNSNCNIGGYNQWKNITVKGGSWNFNRNENDTSTNGFYFYHGQNLNISSVNLLNSTSHILNISGVKKVRINNITIKNQYSTNKEKYDVQQEAIHLDVTSTKGEPKAYPNDVTPTQDVIIENSTFNNILCGIGSHGVPWDSNNDWVFIPKNYNYKNLKSSDYLTYSNGKYISKYKKNYNNIELLKANNIIVQNNIFKDVQDIAINLFAAKNVNINSNQIYGQNMKAFVQVKYAIATITENTYKNGARSNDFIINGNPYSINKLPTCVIINTKNDKNINNECYIKYYSNHYIKLASFKNKIIDSKYSTIKFNTDNENCSNCQNIKIKYGEKFNNKYEYILSLNKKLTNDGTHTFQGWYAYNSANKTWWTNCNGKNSWKNESTIKNNKCQKQLLTNSITISTKFNTDFDKPLYQPYTTIILKPVWKDIEIQNISISKIPNKTNYIKDFEELNLSGGKLTITYKNNSKKTIDLTDNDVSISGFDNTKEDKNQTITVSYKNKVTHFNVNILSKQVEKIEIEKKPNKLNYILNYEKLNLFGGKLKVIYNDNTTDIIDLTTKNIEITGFDNTKIQNNQIIKVKYGEKITSFNINIISNPG